MIELTTPSVRSWQWGRGMSRFRRPLPSRLRTPWGRFQAPCPPALRPKPRLDQALLSRADWPEWWNAATRQLRSVGLRTGTLRVYRHVLRRFRVFLLENAGGSRPGCATPSWRGSSSTALPTAAPPGPGPPPTSPRCAPCSTNSGEWNLRAEFPRPSGRGVSTTCCLRRKWAVCSQPLARPVIVAISALRLRTENFGTLRAAMGRRGLGEPVLAGVVRRSDPRTPRSSCP